MGFLLGESKFENSVITNWLDTRKLSGFNNEFTISGDVLFGESDITWEDLGNQWANTIVKRIFPIYIQSNDTNGMFIEIFNPSGDLTYSGSFDNNGNNYY